MSAVTASPSAPSRDWLLWLCSFAYVMHVLEELEFNWLAWAQAQGLAINGWTSFFATNAAVVFFGLGAALVAWRAPFVSLAYAVLMVVNGVFFHVLPTLVAGRPNPGFLTAALLFLPLGTFTLWSARRDGVLTAKAFGGALAFALFVQVYPLLLIGLRPVLGH